LANEATVATSALQECAVARDTALTTLSEQQTVAAAQVATVLGLETKLAAAVADALAANDKVLRPVSLSSSVL
jgi:hypothetical protein